MEVNYINQIAKDIKVASKVMTEEFVEMLSRVQTFSAGSWPYIDYKELNPYYLASYGYTVTKPYVL